MFLNDILKEKNMTKYQLSKLSGIPKTTIIELTNGTTKLSKCNAETVYKISKALQVPMEELLSPFCEKRCSFELFKSNVCHELKRVGDYNFIKNALIVDDITCFYNRGWYPECFYLLALTDYLSRIHQIPFCQKYNTLRKMKLKECVYPSGVIAICLVEKNDNMKKQAYAAAIPEFIRHNIVEVEVRDVS